jgi:tRNA (cmo5U34)-methyltransferase
MIDGIVSAIPHQRTSAINVIDLGCGTGTISKRIKEVFPRAEITCLDLAENMIEMSKIKLSNYPDVRYQVGDLADYEFDNTI